MVMQLELFDEVQRLVNCFEDLRQDAQNLLNQNEGVFSPEYLTTMVDKYRAAREVCERYLQCDCCHFCIIIKLKSLDLEHYAYDLMSLCYNSRPSSEDNVSDM